MKMIRIFVTLLCMAVLSTKAIAADYTTFLTPERGFTEVTTTSGIINDANYYYLLTPAEVNTLIVGVGAYEAKPDWATVESKALRYKSVDTDPVLNLSNFFTIEKSGQYIGFRNVVYSADMFQTHDNAGFMYVNTYTDKNLDEWSYLTPTYQNGYWIFESGKYPMSSGNWACGYLGPWNKNVADGEPIALNRRNTTGDEAGHYRLFRIAKTELITMYTNLHRTQLFTATTENPVDATWLITNPSFETGDETGWILQNKDVNNYEFKTRDYGMSNKEGGYLMNVYQQWNDHSVSQVLSNVPSGEYELSAELCSWSDRTATLTGQTCLTSVTATIQGVNDQTGILASVNVKVGNDKHLTIIANSTTDWWSSGHTDDYYKQLFYKVDNVRLICKGVYMNGFALPLPNDDVTLLEPGQWYYYDVDYSMEYWLIGNIDDMVYSTDGDKFIANVTTTATSRQMILPRGRVYFKTPLSDATLRITPCREVQELDELTAVALNVDGLPSLINNDGPGSSGTKLISSYLENKKYDIIGISEDFDYHNQLISNMSSYNWGTYRGSVNVLNLFTPANTDGLEFAWNKNNVTALNESWTQWSHSESGDGNQYIKKGFRHYDLTLSSGEVIDVYVLHMDAGDVTSSREQQWTQMASVVNSANANRPKLIIGDTNSRWTREDITANFVNRLNSNFTVADPWVEFYRNGVYPNTAMGDLTDQSDPTNYTNYEIVDKILYINPTAPNTLQLVPQSFRIEQDYTYGTVDGTNNTTPLGDHMPVVVTFKTVKSNELINYHDVTIGNAKYATLSLPWNATIPSGVTAYTSDNFNPSTHKIALQPVTGILPENTGVILYSDTPDTYRFYYNSNDAAAIEDNILLGTEKGRLSQADRSDEDNYAYYVLANRNNHVAMYRLGTATIPQYRSYLKLPKEAVSTMAGVIERVVFGFDQDDIVSEDGGFLDAINSAEDTKSNIIGIYAPSGTRRQEMRKGVNIIQMSNGTTKKVIR